MHRLSIFLATLFSFLIFTCCNSDIFVDDVCKLEKHVEMNCGDTYSFRYSRKGLNQISFSDDPDGISKELCYDIQGNEIPNDSPVEKISRIRYFSPRFVIELSVAGDIMTLHALDNTYPMTLHLELTLDYGHESQTMAIDVAEGSPMQLAGEIEYDGEQVKTGIKIVDLPTQRYRNNSDTPVEIDVWPYLNAPTKVTFITDYKSQWSDGVYGKAYLPCWLNGEWKLPQYISSDMWIEDFQPQRIVLGERVTIESAENTLIDWVTLPAHSDVAFHLSLTYATIEVPFTASLTLPNSGMENKSKGMCYITHAVGYEIVME